MKKILILILALFMGALLVGCGSSSDDDYEDLGPTTTILYYAIGDSAGGSDLDQEIKDNIKLAGMLDTNEEVNVVCQFKLNESEVIRRGIADEDEDDWEDYESISTGKMTDSDTLKDFIEYGKTKCPADRYVLLLSGHGDGYNSRETKACLLSNDDSFLSNGTVAEVCKPYNIDCVIFNSCMMGSIENLYCAKDSFKYIISSERSISNFSLYNLMSSLVTFEDLETALGIFTKKQGDVSNGTYDVRLIKTANFSLLSNSIKDIITFLNSNQTNYKTEIKEARDNIKTIDVNSNLVDFEDYCNHLQELISNNDFANLINAYKTALDEVVLYNYSLGENESVGASLGVSLLFPSKEDYIKNYKENYVQTLFAQDTQWNKFLENFPEN